MSSEDVSQSESSRTSPLTELSRKMSMENRLSRTKCLFRSARDVRRSKSNTDRPLSCVPGVSNEAQIPHVVKIDFIEQISTGKHCLDNQNYKMLFYNQTLLYLFLGFQLKFDSPKELLFAILVEFIRNPKIKKSQPLKDLSVFAYHIYSLFLDERSPLVIAELAKFRDKIAGEMTLDYESRARNLFNDAFEENIKKISQQFSSFIEQKNDIYDKYLGRSAHISITHSPIDFYSIMGDHLEAISAHFKLPAEFEEKHSYQIGLVVAFQTLFLMDKFKTFPAASKVPFLYFVEKRRKSKPTRKRFSMLKCPHNYSEIFLTRPTTCAQCDRLIWGMAPQAVECLACSTVTHTFCADFEAACPRKKSNNVKLPFRHAIPRERKTLIRLDNEKQKFATLRAATISGRHNFDTMFSNGEEFHVENFSEVIFDSDLDYPADLPDPQSLFADFKSFSSNSRKLHQVFIEICHTERSHLRWLKIMNTLFYKPLVEFGTFSDLTKIIFPQLGDLIDHHSMLVKSLRERISSQIINDKFADSLMPLFNDSIADSFSSACIAFCSDQKHVLNVLKFTLKSNSDFSLIISDAEKSKLCRDLKLSDLILSQMQRLTRYPLLIDQIIKLSKPYPEEIEKLTKIKSFALLYLTRVNEQAAIRENHKFLLSLIPQVEVKQEVDMILPPYDSFDIDNKKLLHYGEAGIKINKKHNDVLLLLFPNDLVILFKSDNTHYILRSFVYKASKKVLATYVSPVIELSRDLVIRPLAADKKCFLVLHQKKLQLIEFHTNSEARAKMWVTMIINSINDRVSTQEKIPPKPSQPQLEPSIAPENEPVSRLKKINSMYERTVILLAEREKVREESHFGVLVSMFHEILKNVNSNVGVNSDYMSLSFSQLPNLQAIVQTLETIKTSDLGGLGGKVDTSNLKDMAAILDTCSMDSVDDKGIVSSGTSSDLTKSEELNGVVLECEEFVPSFNDTLKQEGPVVPAIVPNSNDGGLKDCEESEEDVDDLDNNVVSLQMDELSDNLSIISFDENT